MSLLQSAHKICMYEHGTCCNQAASSISSHYNTPWVPNNVSKLRKKAATRNKIGSCKAVQYWHKSEIITEIHARAKQKHVNLLLIKSAGKINIFNKVTFLNFLFYFISSRFCHTDKYLIS